jgi:hypothetical protein
MTRKQQQKNGVFCAVRANVISRDNDIETEERCFLRGPYRDVIRRSVGATLLEKISVREEPECSRLLASLP